MLETNVRLKLPSVAFKVIKVITVCPKLKFTNLVGHVVFTHFVKIELQFLESGGTAIDNEDTDTPFPTVAANTLFSLRCFSNSSSDGFKVRIYKRFAKRLGLSNQRDTFGQSQASIIVLSAK